MCGEFMVQVTVREIHFVGHIVRQNKLEAIAVTGKIGKQARGRQGKTFTDWMSTAGGEHALDIHTDFFGNVMNIIDP